MRIGPRFVASMSDADRDAVIAEFDEFEAVGSIGDCLLRNLAKECFPHTQITTAMRDLAFECHRYYSARYLQIRSHIKT